MWDKDDRQVFVYERWKGVLQQLTFAINLIHRVVHHLQNSKVNEQIRRWIRNNKFRCSFLFLSTVQSSEFQWEEISKPSKIHSSSLSEFRTQWILKTTSSSENHYLTRWYVGAHNCLPAWMDGCTFHPSSFPCLLNTDRQWFFNQ